MYSTTGFRTFSPKAEATTAAAVTKQQNKWVRNRKALCWVCQKDVPQDEGRFSFLIKRKGSLTSGNALRKFVCFKCKPDPAPKPVEEPPCPFCGSTLDLENHPDLNDYPRCKNCGAC